MLFATGFFAISIDTCQQYKMNEEQAEEQVHNWLQKDYDEKDPEEIIDDISYLIEQSFNEVLGEETLLNDVNLYQAGVRLTITEDGEVVNERWIPRELTNVEKEAVELIAEYVGPKKLKKIKVKQQKFQDIVNLIEEADSNSNKKDLREEIDNQIEINYGVAYPEEISAYVWGLSGFAFPPMNQIFVEWEEIGSLYSFIQTSFHEYGHILVSQKASVDYNLALGASFIHFDEWKLGKYLGCEKNEEINCINETAVNEIAYNMTPYFYEKHEFIFDIYFENEELANFENGLLDVSLTLGPEVFYDINKLIREHHKDSNNRILNNSKDAKKAINERYSSSDVKKELHYLYEELGLKDFIVAVGYFYYYEDVHDAYKIVKKGGDLGDIIQPK